MDWLKRFLGGSKDTSYVPPRQPVGQTPLPRFAVTRLPDFRAFDLNCRGQIVGSRDSKPVLYSDGEFRVLLEIEAGPDMYGGAYRMNEAGQVLLGTTRIHRGDPRESYESFCYLWEEGRLTEIGPWNGIGLNESGTVLIERSAAQGARHSTEIWSNGEIRAVGPDGFSGACLNSAGDVAGTFQRDGRCAAAVWCAAEDRLVEIAQASQVFVEGINDRGQVLLATAPSADDDMELGIWTPGEGVHTILSDVRWLNDADINNHGEAAGFYAYPDGIPYVYGEADFYWDGKQEHSLELLVKETIGFSGARAINDRGEILAFDEEQSFLLTPISGGTG